MVLNLFKKQSKKQIIALDIGSHSTKIMSIEKEDHLVKDFVVAPTPENVFQDGLISDEESLSSFIGSQIGAMNIEDEFSVILGISGKGMISKKIDVPEIDDHMIPEFVEIEAEQELFYNRDEMELDYQILEGLNFKKPENKSIFVVTVLKSVVKSYNKLLDKNGIQCDVLDTNFGALFNAFEFNYDIEESENYMLLDIGKTTTNLTVVVKKQVIFARNINLGGDFFTSAIQKRMSVDYNMAEDLKISTVKEGEAPQDIVSLIESTLNKQFIEEFISPYELYNGLFPEQPINKLYLAGGGIQTIGLISEIEKFFNCPVKILDPFLKLEFPLELKKHKEDYKRVSSVVTGLALRSLE
ncbi:MAG: type IV pilus assembly protein PilM [Bdellovibrionaceae bacterium]|nr:type IV pilus assembly protein PilM [Pseudobdellovibrionaceae bacterium]